MTVKRVLLVNPPGTAQDGYSGPPLGLLYLAGAVRSAGVDVRVVDGYLWGWARMMEAIYYYKPDILGVTCLTPGRHAALRVLKMAKTLDPSILTVMGGAHASIMWRQILENYAQVDLIAWGEGEETMMEIARDAPWNTIRGVAYRENGIARLNPLRPMIDDLDTLPMPAWDLLGLYGYPARGCGVHNGVDTSRVPRVPVAFGRGCTGHCSFCSSWWLWHGYRHRSPGNMMKELEYLYHDRGCRHFYFVDDSFTVDRGAIMRLCNLIIGSGMDIAFTASTRCDLVDTELLEKLHNAGCYELSMGVESGSPRVLEHIENGKNSETSLRAIGMCKEAGIRAIALLIIGSKGETWRSILETISFLNKARPDGIGSVGGLWLLPGTRAYSQNKKAGYIDDDFWLGPEPYKLYTRERGPLTLKVWDRMVHHYSLFKPITRNIGGTDNGQNTIN